MQHDNVLEKMNFALLTHLLGRDGVGEGVYGYNIFIRDHIYYDIRHDHILKKLNCDL